MSEDQTSREGRIAPLENDEQVRAAVERAFDYRGDVTLRLKDGRMVVGYIFDRRADAAALAECHVRLMPADGGPIVTIAYEQIAALEFTGRDTAAGKSYQTWLKNYHARKSAGESSIRLEPEPLE